MTLQPGGGAMNGGSRADQRGGFVVGLVVGLLVGLAVALGVALYVTKVPVPFVNKVPQRTAEQDAAEAEKNKNWDPNSPLYGKNPARSASGAVSGAVPPPVATAASTPPVTGSARDPAAILADRAPVPPAVKGSALPLGADPFLYFVQAGAYARTEDAEQQRARLAIMGHAAKVTEREQSGRTMYRVRIGPFDRKDDADAAKDKLTAAGVDAALVRVQK
jgi:cell division protein FtsN